MAKRSGSPYEAALEVVLKLRQAGHVALFAGGCVRDMLLGVAPKDYDVATDAPPPNVTRLFPHARHVGAKFGVMIVRVRGHDLEVATFRADGVYSDGRRPDAVEFTDARCDAQRRDFTINGLFFDPIDKQVLDYVDGQADLKARRLRTIGDPEQRFTEDHLRMLRAVRFASRLGFTLDPTTFKAIQGNAARLRGISAERIAGELEMLLTAPTRRAAWSFLLESGLRPYLSEVWPSSPHDDEFTGRVLENLPDRPIEASLAYASVWTARTSSEIDAIARSLRLSNPVRVTATWLIESFHQAARSENLELADVKLLLAHPAWDQLLLLLRAYLPAARQPLDRWSDLSARAGEIAPDDICPPPLLTGDDLSAHGLAPGPLFGVLLSEAYRAQLNGMLTSRADAEAWLQGRLAGERQGHAQE